MPCAAGAYPLGDARRASLESMHTGGVRGAGMDKHDGESAARPRGAVHIMPLRKIKIYNNKKET